MRLLVVVLAVVVGGVAGQGAYYPRSPLRPIAPFGYSSERVVTQGRISTGPTRSSFERPSGPIRGSGGSGDPCRPSPCGPNTRCQVNPNGVALCRCLDDYVPDGDTINGCKPQCLRDSDCPDDYRCRGTKCVRVCETGACGFLAECKARNHKAVCSCPEYYSGDPYVTCRREEPEHRDAPPAPYRSPCESSPCGHNAECTVRNDRAVCTCPLGYEGDPLLSCLRGECISSEDCPHNKVCQSLRCIDPCTVVRCGRNADCSVKDRQAVCTCRHRYAGDALVSCHYQEPCSPSPCGRNTNCREENERAVCSCIANYIGDPLTGCRPECEVDSECPADMACRNNLCYNPCRDACGENAYCDIRNRRAVCTCPQFYRGEPYSRCYAECTQHDDCPSHQACINLRCGDPCQGACGIGANCQVKRHKPICSCPKTHTGHPFERCRPFTDADLCTENTCGVNTDCSPGTDRDGEKRAVCTCKTGYVGNPLIACQLGECQGNSDCPGHQACHNYMCINPCFVNSKSVCGENAQCNVKNRAPVCSCAPGYVGDPLQQCYIPPSKGDYDDFRRY